MNCGLACIPESSREMTICGAENAICTLFSTGHDMATTWFQKESGKVMTNHLLHQSCHPV
jgi:hypothetical protein